MRYSYGEPPVTDDIPKVRKRAEYMQGSIDTKSEIRYFLNDNNENILIKYIKPTKFYVFRKGRAEWILLPADNSYMRELFIGQGNNCMTEITETEVKKYMKELIKK